MFIKHLKFSGCSFGRTCTLSELAKLTHHFDLRYTKLQMYANKFSDVAIAPQSTMSPDFFASMHSTLASLILRKVHIIILV